MRHHESELIGSDISRKTSRWRVAAVEFNDDLEALP
jgi:hypothetical protein